jgi:hypothetical protein
MSAVLVEASTEPGRRYGSVAAPLGGKTPILNASRAYDDLERASSRNFGRLGRSYPEDPWKPAATPNFCPTTRH